MSNIVLEVQLGDQAEVSLEACVYFLDLSDLVALDNGFRSLGCGVEAEGHTVR